MSEKMLEAVSEYLATLPTYQRNKLLELRRWVLEVVPECQEKFTYGMPTYHYKKNLMHFAFATKHLGIYPGPRVIAALSEQLTAFEQSKGTIKVPLDQLDLMNETLFKSLVQWNVDNLIKK